jgi:hypothetical protein
LLENERLVALFSEFALPVSDLLDLMPLFCCTHRWYVDKDRSELKTFDCFFDITCLQAIFVQYELDAVVVNCVALHYMESIFELLAELPSFEVLLLLNRER